MLNHVETPEFRPFVACDQALAAFDAGAKGANPDWEALGKALRASLASVSPDHPALAPARRRRTGKPAATAGKAKIADYPVDHVNRDRLQWPSPIVEFIFADNTLIRAPAVSLKGKPVNVGRAARLACAFYESRKRDKDGTPPFVPEIIAAAIVGGNPDIDVDAVNAATIDARGYHPPRVWGNENLYNPRDYYRRLRRTLNPEWPAERAWIEALRHTGRTYHAPANRSYGRARGHR